MELERITGEKVAECILCFLKENGIPVVNMCGRRYDGASNMSSPQVGVQAKSNGLLYWLLMYTAVAIALTWLSVGLVPNHKCVVCLNIVGNAATTFE